MDPNECGYDLKSTSPRLGLRGDPGLDRHAAFGRKRGAGMSLPEDFGRSTPTELKSSESSQETRESSLRFPEDFQTLEGRNLRR
jgi:hypothetical protein